MGEQPNEAGVPSSCPLNQVVGAPAVPELLLKVFEGAEPRA